MNIYERKSIKKIESIFESIKSQINDFLFEVNNSIEKSKSHGIKWISIEKIRYSYNKTLTLIKDLLKIYKFKIIFDLLELNEKLYEIKSLITNLYNIFNEDINNYDIWLLEIISKNSNTNTIDYDKYLGKKYEKTSYIDDLYNKIYLLLL